MDIVDKPVQHGVRDGRSADPLVSLSCQLALRRCSPVSGASPFKPSAPSLTNPFNLSGNPAMSVPIGLDTAGLPRGVQIVGRLFDEATLLRVGRTIEKRSGWESVAMPRFDNPASETA